MILGQRAQHAINRLGRVKELIHIDMRDPWQAGLSIDALHIAGLAVLMLAGAAAHQGCPIILVAADSLYPGKP